jgi:spore coat polysaccharide biosynthesis protein SpsF
LDTPEDLEVIRTLIEQYEALGLGVDQIIDVLSQHPELVGLNAHVEQKKLGQ